jgi:hypothetical protein
MYDHVRRRRWHPIVLLLLLPLVGTLVPEFYNHDAPSIGGHAVLLVRVRVDPGQRGMHLDRVTRHQEAAVTAQYNRLEFGIVIAIFAVITVLGFVAVRWKRAPSLQSIDEWGLGDRRFGTRVTWFLLGGDLYTAYTFVSERLVVRDRRHRFLCGALHDRGLPDSDVRRRPGCGRSATGTVTPPRPISSGAGTDRVCSRCLSRSPASSSRCLTSRYSWLA